MKTLLFPILSVIAAVGLYFFFIAPNLAEISTLQAKDAEFSQSLDDVREIETIMSRLETSYAGITNDDLVKLERFLPREIDKTQIVTDIGALLTEEGVIIREIDLTGASRKSSRDGEESLLLEQGVKFSFFAKYDGFKKVLKSIESNLQIASVFSVRTGPSGTDYSNEEDLGLTQYEIELVFYSYNLEDE